MESGSPFGTIQPQPAKHRKQSDLKPTRAQMKIIIAVLAVVLLVVGGVVVYKKGEASGKKIGRKESTANFNNPFNMFSNGNNGNSSNNGSNKANPLPIKTIVGTITKIQNDQLTIKETNSGKEYKLQTTSDTVVAQKADNKKLSDLKENQSVTIFSRTNDDNLVATRILIK